MKTISEVTGMGICVRGNDIDTDQIIPARFMKCVTFDGIGTFAFDDERKRAAHPFDDPRWAGHPILVVNSNFGCGSSREHAPQALMDYGIRAVVGESFAEIFAGNCSTLGVPAMTLSAHDIATLQSLIEETEDTVVTIDIESMTASAGGHSWTAGMPGSYRRALLDGSWDSTAVLASATAEVDRVAGELPYL